MWTMDYLRCLFGVRSDLWCSFECRHGKGDASQEQQRAAAKSSKILCGLVNSLP